MKKKHILLILSACISSYFVRAQEQEKDKQNIITETLHGFIENYKNYNTIGYKVSTLINGEPVDTLSFYLEKVPSDTIIGIRFQAKDNLRKITYNGREIFIIGLKSSPESYLTKNDYENIPVGKPFPVVFGYLDSYPCFAKVFESVINDQTCTKELLNDTIIDNRVCRRIRLHYDNKRIFGDQYYEFPADLSVFFNYVLCIDTELNLLRQLTVSNSFGDTSTYRYADYLLDIPEADILWNKEEYPDLKEYERFEYELIEKGDKLPSFQAELAGKGQIDENYFKDRISLLFFWDTGCGASQMTNETVNNIFKKYPDIIVLGLNNDDTDQKDIDIYLVRVIIGFPVAIGSEEVSKIFGTDATPTILIFDKNGILENSVIGYYNDLQSDLENIINNITE